jgi:hypothetical protein
MNTKRGERPAPLEGARRRFKVWRETHEIRSRIPDSLWNLAVRMARTYGIHRTSKALQVNYYTLKQRLEEPSEVSPAVPAGGAGANFLELVPSASAGSGECTLELENAAGAKMRISLKGLPPPDLMGLSRSFFGGES